MFKDVLQIITDFFPLLRAVDYDLKALACEISNMLRYVFSKYEMIMAISLECHTVAHCFKVQRHSVARSVQLLSVKLLQLMNNVTQEK